ncbi:hypothetical protein BDV35DRAFT_174304 [Aspergillus flavus]|uniref:DUF7730 domain-containing protein n=2 Tax=Aspergillus subgen. Circumdati TaxID=2720871 RepID=A0A364MR19_ASPFL|nr:hypothetical protein BDV35DRAFT_174304 [Aspergillus flavus]RAQ81704.1 hypothetical protein COH21_011477 [Aspergillus flavus]RMZ45215.1 hypothetical protein CA14_006971 [Aspergillus flavus]UDD63171.1 hypothetical protein AFCA_010446 [Aspergillus flavus]
MSFPLLKLPTELRLDIYRHLFGISPTTRLFLGLINSPLHPNERANPLHIFEICYFPLSHPHMTHYQTNTGYQVEWAQHQIYSRSRFLAILVTCKKVYSEAMPLFYSESFFAISANINTAVSWLAGIGAQRRRHIRRLSVHFDSIPPLRPRMNWNEIQDSMEAMSGILMDVDRIDVLELLIVDKQHEHYLACMAARIHLKIPWYNVLREPGKPLLLHGIEQLERLPRLGCLRIVGHMGLLLRFSEDRAYLEGFAKGKKPAGLGDENEHKPVVQVLMPEGMDSDES